jgi:hypothetical protein
VEVQEAARGASGEAHRQPDAPIDFKHDLLIVLPSHLLLQAIL